MGTHEGPDDPSEDMMMVDPSGSALGLAGNGKPLAPKNSKGKAPWDAFSETSSSGAAPRVTPPPPPLGLARPSSSTFSLDDVSMGSPSASSNGGGGGGASQSNNPFALPGAGGAHTTTSSSGNGTPQALASHGGSGGSSTQGSGPGLPSAAEITRRINSKRRRDDDLDPVGIKRRAVSPGMSVHNSPVMQSPLQRDTAPWGSNGYGSRPGSVGGGDAAAHNKPGPGSSGAPSENGSVSGRVSSKGLGRVGFQGMVETNDGITKLSIE